MEVMLLLRTCTELARQWAADQDAQRMSAGMIRKHHSNKLGLTGSQMQEMTDEQILGSERIEPTPEKLQAARERALAGARADWERARRYARGGMTGAERHNNIARNLARAMGIPHEDHRR